MALSPMQFLREGGGELTEKHFLPSEDPEEVLQGYILDAATKVSAVDAALRDGIAAKWVYYRAYQSAYAWVLMEPQGANVGEAGTVNFLNPDGLMKIALSYKEQFDDLLAAALVTPAVRPYGPTRNEYIF